MNSVWSVNEEGLIASYRLGLHDGLTGIKPSIATNPWFNKAYQQGYDTGQDLYHFGKSLRV